MLFAEFQNGWEKELSLQLDHKDGDRKNNTFDNLRWLCPNCHTQTETWGRKKAANRCRDCNKKIGSKSVRCRNCDSKRRVGKNTKINWPSIDELKKLVEKTSFVYVAKILGVSDNAVRKRINKYKRM